MSMKRTAIEVIVLLVAALTLPTVAAAGPDFTEGMWEIKGELKLQGLPFAMPAMPIAFSQCLTKENMVPQEKNKDQDCTKVSEKIEGNTVTFVTRCKGKKGEVTEGTGTITYSNNTFNSAIRQVTTDGKGNASTADMTMTGHRTGDCK
jgi:hypothetical protein